MPVLLVLKFTDQAFKFIKCKKLNSLHYCVRATKSHIQNSRSHLPRIQSDRTMNWWPLQTHVM